jgi:hypothetical protein
MTKKMKGEKISKKKRDGLCARYFFTKAQNNVLSVMLREKGFEIE